MTIQLRAGVSTAEVDGAQILLDERSGTYYKLNPTGALILRTLLEGGTPSDAATQMQRRYEVDPDRAEGDVSALLIALHDANLVSL